VSALSRLKKAFYAAPTKYFFNQKDKIYQKVPTINVS
jgi:hypothetical protein